MYKITVKTEGDVLTRATGNPTIQSLDGESQARLRTILHESWTAEERAAYGVHQVTIDPPEGERFTGQIDNVGGKPVPVYEPNPELAISELVEAKEQEIHDELSATMAAIGADYSAAERETWYRQLEEAREHKGNGNAHTPMLEAYSRGNSNEKSALADRILALADQLATLTGQALADKQDRVTALEAIDLEAADARDQIEAV